MTIGINQWVGVTRPGQDDGMTMMRTMAGALLAATLAAAPAAAVIKVAIYQGTVADGYDLTGEFGTPDTDLTGDPFVARYVYNTRLGHRLSLGDHDQIWGGASLGVPSPILRVTIQIGGGVWSSNSLASDGLAVADNGYYGTEFADSQPFGGGMVQNTFVENYGYRTASTSSLDASFGVRSSSPNDYGYIQIYMRDDVTGRIVHFAYADLGAATLEVGSVAEPATWGLIIGGFGAIGTLARRRRAQATGRAARCRAPVTSAVR